MLKLIYITHPQVIIDAKTPIDQWQLSKDGLEAVERLSQLQFWDDVNKIYSSKETKAFQVAEIISKKFNIAYEAYENFNELDRQSTGLLPINKYMEAVKFTYENFDTSYKGWETLESSYNRNTKQLTGIINGNKGKNIVIIGHGSAGTLIKCFIKGIKPSFSEDPQKTGCYFVADYKKGKILQDWRGY